MGTLALVLWTTLAVAAPIRGAYYLESPASEVRSDAAAVVRAASDAGYRAHVARRYRHGVGWEYVAVVEGFDDPTIAADAAGLITSRAGRGLVVYASEEEEPPEPAPIVEPPAEEEAPSDWNPDEEIGAALATVLSRTRRAHGGAGGGRLVLSEADAVVFRFRRRLPDGLVVLHTYARQDDRRYVDVMVEAGEGTSSQTWSHPAEAWLVVDGGAAKSVDAVKTREVVELFSPERVAALPLAVADAVVDRPEIARSRIVDDISLNGVPCTVLRYDGDTVASPLEIAVDTERFLVRRWKQSMPPGGLVVELEDYRDLATQLVIPFRLRTAWDGVSTDEVEILELDLAPGLPREWLAPPHH